MIASAGDFSEDEVIEGAALAPKKDYRGGKVQLQLMSEVKSIQPGKKFTVGLWIRHQPGWHTYWTNPGVVGVATTFQWDLPEGFSAGPVQWPAPQRTEMATLTAYGYEGECVLLMDISVPENLSADSGPVTLRTKVGWMACATSCHPGWSDFELTLPVKDVDGRSAPDLNQAAHELIEAERGRFPEKIDGWKFSASRVTGSGEDGAEEKWLELRVSPEGDTQAPGTLAEWGDVYFFSIDDQVDSDSAQKLRRDKDGSLTLRMKLSQYAPDDPKTLSGVLYRGAGWGPKAHPWMWVDAPW